MMKIIELKDLTQAEAELRRIGCDETGVRIMREKAVFRVMKIEGIRSKAANLLKQTFLGKGAEAAVTRGAADLSVECTDALVMATVRQYRQAIAQLKMQPWGLAAIAARMEKLLADNGLPRRVYQWKDRSLHLDGRHSVVMGILNLTPDSFSDGGRYNSLEAAIRHAEEMQSDGAGIIDIGAESTRPYGNGQKISANEEMERLLPALEKILPHCSVPVSVDTYKACVAEEALKCGAHIINDIWGLQGDAGMAEVAARYDVPVIVMHNQREIFYSADIMQDIQGFLKKSIKIGIENHVKRENIIIDPGIGFAKDFSHNMEIIARLDALQALDCPILLAASRKRFIGDVLGCPAAERDEGTAAVSSLGRMKGAQIHRVHDVKMNKRMLTMLDAVLEEEWRN